MACLYFKDFLPVLTLRMNDRPRYSTLPHYPETTFLPCSLGPEVIGFKPWDKQTAALPGMVVTKHPAACLSYQMSTRPWCFFLIEAEMFLPCTGYLSIQIDKGQVSLPRSALALRSTCISGLYNWLRLIPFQVLYNTWLAMPSLSFTFSTAKHLMCLLAKRWGKAGEQPAVNLWSLSQIMAK